MTTYQVGDIVVRTEGEWRGVKPGDVHTVSGVWRYNIELVGFEGVSFDGDNFMKQTATPPPAPWRPGYTHLEDINVGDHVVFIDESGEGDSCAIKGDTGVVTSINDTELVTAKMSSGVIIQVMKRRLRKQSPFSQLVRGSLVTLTNDVAPVPEISIDEAVEACKTARSEIAELEAKVKDLRNSIKGYEQVLHKSGLKFI